MSGMNKLSKSKMLQESIKNLANGHSDQFIFGASLAGSSLSFLNEMKVRSQEEKSKRNSYAQIFNSEIVMRKR